jgi:hypothetical protein
VHIVYTAQQMQYRTVRDKVTESNFTPEDLMRCTNNINLLYRRLGDRTAEVTLYPVDITEEDDEEPGFVTGFVPRVYIAGEEVPSRQDELNILMRKVYTTREWYIADLAFDVRYKDTTLPAKWIQRVAPRILTSQQYIEDDFLVQETPVGCSSNRDVFQATDPWDTDSSESDEDLYIEKTIFVTDLQIGDPRRTHATVYFNFLDTLLSLYKMGTIDKVSDQFVIGWELKEDVTYRGLYHPTWTNTLVAPDQSKYLLRVALSGKPESYSQELANPVFDFYGRNRCLTQCYSC